LIVSELKYVSMAVCAIVLVGIAVRKHRRVHIPLMLTALAIDLGVVLFIEFDRGAFQSAQDKMGPMMIIHISFSAMVLILYGIQVATGIARLRGRPGLSHAKWPVWFLIARFGNLITSFLIM
jgi:hypothetical protein